jgi:signal transduction histidine kinase
VLTDGDARRGATGSVADAQERWPAVRRLERRFALALLAIALLTIANQCLVQPALHELSRGAPLINVAGRQRMYSQRLMKSAFALERSADAAAFASSMQEFRLTAENWRLTHEDLTAGNLDRHLPGPANDVIRTSLDELTPAIEAMLSIADAIQQKFVEPPQGDAQKRELHGLVSGLASREPEYLRRMEATVALYEQDSRARVIVLRRIGWGLTGGVLVALFAIGAGVLLPATRMLRAQFQDRLRGELSTRLARAGRLHALGAFAAGVAHEVNQPLGAIANFSAGCLQRMEAGRAESRDLERALSRINSAALRAGQIVDRVRRLCRQAPPERREVGLESLLRETCELCAAEARGRGVELLTRLSADLPTVVADPIEIQQVLLNLVQNGMQALESQPTSRRRTVQIEVAADHEGAVFVAVHDNGPGIDVDVLSTIFEPFVSTKPEGMGMGLAICRAIIDAHGGRLWCQSSPGEGSTFRFTLPASGSSANTIHPVAMGAAGDGSTLLPIRLTAQPDLPGGN